MPGGSHNPFSSDFLRGNADDRLRPQGSRSYVAGLTDHPLRFMTIPQLLDRACARHGGRSAAVFGAGTRLSWHDLRERSDEVAAGLLAMGVGRGDRVGLWAPSRREWLAVQFGTARIGAILVGIDPLCGAAQLEHALSKTGCKMLVMAPRQALADPIETLRVLAPEVDSEEATLRAARLPHLRHVVILGEEGLPAGARSFAELVALAGPGHRARVEALSGALDPDDAIVVAFAAAGNEPPKGATLSHFSIVNNARFAARSMALTVEDRLCIPVPLYRTFGMVLGVLCCTAVGAAMVFPGESFDPEATLAAVAHHQCTALHGLPAMFIAALEHPNFSTYDTSSLRTGILAGGPCPPETVRRIAERMHLRELTVGHGMAETGPLSFQSRSDDAMERRAMTVGRIHPHVEAKIIAATGRVVRIGTPGELCIRGYGVMRGYWDDVEASAAAVDASRWMHSGDLATIDDQGYCTIVGRLKDTPVRGTDNA